MHIKALEDIIRDYLTPTLEDCREMYSKVLQQIPRRCLTGRILTGGLKYPPIERDCLTVYG